MATNDGGPAFPLPGNNGSPGLAGYIGPLTGMSLRDYFAARFMAVADEYAHQATQNQIIELFGDRCSGIRREQIASRVAYRMADAMISARSR